MQDEAKQDKTRRDPKKLSPDFEKYCSTQQIKWPNHVFSYEV